MTTFNWTSGTNGDWNTGTLWTPATVPTAADDVVIDAANTAYTVTIAGGETETVHSLSMNDTVGRLGTNDAAGYHAAELLLDGTLAFAAGSAGALDGPLQNYVFTDVGANAAIINGGTLNAFLQVAGTLTLTGTNAVYITNEIQALGGTVTIDTPIATMNSTTLFDGIFQAKGIGSVMNLGGAGNTVNIVTMEGPQDNPTGWTELTFADPTSVIDEWNGTKYVSIETSLTEISGGGTVDVTFGRNFNSTNALTIDHLGNSVGAGMLNMQGVTVTTAGININGGIVQGYGTIASDVVNNGTVIALGGTAGGTLDVAGNLSGTGVVLFDANAQQGANDPTLATLVLHGVSAGQTITMNSGDTLELANPGAFAGTIVAGLGDKIVLDGLTATSAVVNNGTLVVSNGSVVVASLALSGNYTGESITTAGSVLTFGTAAPSQPVMSGDVLGLAAQITAQLTAMGTAGTLQMTTDNNASPVPNAPPVGPGTANELVLSGPGGLAATIPAGYSHVLVQTDSADTIHGANVVLVGGSVGGAYGVTGNSTVVATGGNNLVFASDNFTISTGDGNNTVSASGNGTVATDHGTNLIFAAGSTTVLSVGQDTIVGGAGTTTAQSSGDNTLIFGEFGASDGVMNLALSGGAVTVSGGNSAVTTTLSGSNALVFGAPAGGGTLNVLDQGTNDTISGLSSATTVTGGNGSSGLLAFGGSGGLDFVGGASAATVMTSAGQNVIKVGSGGLLLAAGGNDNVTGDGGAVTLFGSAGNTVNYSSAGDLLYGAGSGNETLNAAGSTGNGAYFAGAGADANDAIIGGSGTNVFIAGGGSDTFTGGSGTNIFDFMAATTAGHGEFIVNMTASDSVNLTGYDPSKSTVSTAGGNTTLTLSDNTQITFVNLANLPGSIHYS